MNATVDLRSDTVTRPTAAMRAAMFSAPLGDDVYGDDPSVNALQERIADMLGYEAALFMPTGTQSNLCGLMAHCQRGDEYLVGQSAHTYRYEGGGAAVLGSIQPQPLALNAAGQMALADIANAIKPDDSHFARTRLLCLENTWSGYPMPLDYLAQTTALARGHGLGVHLDGAPKPLLKHTDTLSKWLVMRRAALATASPDNSVRTALFEVPAAASTGSARTDNSTCAKAAAALNKRAPSKCTANPCPRAKAVVCAR